MRFAFINIEAESYAIMLFSSILKQQGHEVFIVFDPRLFMTDEIRNNRLARFFDVRQRNIDKLKDINPDYIGFSVYTQDYQWSLEFARMIKQQLCKPIIFGGIHCTLCPDEVIAQDCVDIVCVGEGEEAIKELANNPNKDIKNLWFKDKHNGLRPLLEDLDSLPFMDRDIFYNERRVFNNDYTISTGRGCPNQCTFCASVALGNQYKGLGRYVRQRSVDNVIEELRRAKKRYHPKSIYFTDDIFTLQLKWLEDFVPKYKEIGLPFYCTANPGTIKKEMLPLLKQAGCQMIGFGLQSCNEEFRSNQLRRVGSNDRIKEIARICHELQLPFSFDHIFDIPGDTEENQYEAIEFYTETRPALINTFTMTYLPKIELNRYLTQTEQEEVNNGRIRTAMVKRGRDLFNSVFSLLSFCPKVAVQKIIKHRICIPFWLRLLLKDIARIRIGRWSDVLFPIKLLGVNIWSRFFYHVTTKKKT